MKNLDIFYKKEYICPLIFKKDTQLVQQIKTAFTTLFKN